MIPQGEARAGEALDIGLIDQLEENPGGGTGA